MSKVNAILNLAIEMEKAFSRYWFLTKDMCVEKNGLDVSITLKSESFGKKTEFIYDESLRIYLGLMDGEIVAKGVKMESVLDVFAEKII